MADGSRAEYERLRAKLHALDAHEAPGVVKEAVEHILERLGPPEPDAEQALAEAAEAFYGSHKSA